MGAQHAFFLGRGRRRTRIVPRTAIDAALARRRDEIADTQTSDVVATCETVIRDLAASVVNAADNRRNHPTFGNTKTAIRTMGNTMEGAIGLFMVLTEQASHPGVPRLAIFTDPRTTARVFFAREAVENL
jgi:hypothetical protein